MTNPKTTTKTNEVSGSPLNWLDVDDLLVEFNDHMANLEEPWSELPPAVKKRLATYAAKKGKMAVAGFRTWLERSRGFTVTKADKSSHVAWLAVSEHPKNPTRKLIEENLPHAQKMALRTGLREFASYLLQVAKSSPAEQEYARLIINNLALIPVRDPLSIPAKKKKPPTDPTKSTSRQPMSEENIAKLLHTIEVRHIREGGKHPWARSLCRITVILGLRDSVSIVQITYTDVVEALRDHDEGKYAGLPMWARGKALMLPVRLIADELRVLVSWPTPWGTIADLIASGTDYPAKSAAAWYLKEMKATAKEAGVFEGTKTLQSIRSAAIRRLYKEHRDLVLLQALHGLSIRRLKKLPYMADLLEEERHRVVSNI